MPTLIFGDQGALQFRVNQLFQFREQHERLLNVFSVVLSGEEGDLC